MTDIGLQARQLSNLLEPLAAMMVKKIRPVEDELTLNAAYKTFGRAWVERQRLEGNLTLRPKGKYLILSRAELETLRAVDNATVKAVIKPSTRRNNESLGND